MGQMGAQKLTPRGFPSRTHGAAAPGGFYLNSLLLKKKISIIPDYHRFFPQRESPPLRKLLKAPPGGRHNWEGRKAAKRSEAGFLLPF